MTQIILASSSPIRARLLQDAGVDVQCQPARIDEETVRASLDAEQAKPRDQADTLAEMKAARVSARHPDAIVIGCDQVLDFHGEILGKPASVDAARAQLVRLRGQTHKLVSAIVLYRNGKPEWRHVGEARLTMRQFSDQYLDAYLTRNAAEVTESVGGYKLEQEGIRLFERIDGDYFTILGLPLLPLLNHLSVRGLVSA